MERRQVAITTTRLKQEIKAYKKECENKHKRPSYRGLAKRLHISDATICHIVNNNYEHGKPYTSKPGSKRCIANKDFAIIRNLYKRNSTKSTPINKRV